MVLAVLGPARVVRPKTADAIRGFMGRWIAPPGACLAIAFQFSYKYPHQFSSPWESGKVIQHLGGEKTRLLGCCVRREEARKAGECPRTGKRQGEPPKARAEAPLLRSRHTLT